jgi:hypothetical protein
LFADWIEGLTLKRFSVFSMVLAIMTLMASTSPALAYLDPGTGSILLQMLLGGVAGGLVVARLYWARIKGWFSPGKPPSDNEQGPGGA